MSLAFSYCTVNGLQSPAARRHNGQECFVFKPDPDNEGRWCVLFNNNRNGFVSIKAENLTRSVHVAVRPATTMVEKGGKVTEVPIGKGLFATKAFKQGEIIFSEKVLNIPYYWVDRTPADGRPCAEEMEELVEEIGDKVSAAEKEILESLGTGTRTFPADGDEGVSPWWLRITTNGVVVPQLRGIRDPNRIVVAPMLSSINHACLGRGQRGANVWIHLNKADGDKHCITAGRDIAEGEELLMDYFYWADHMKLCLRVRKSFFDFFHNIAICESNCLLCNEKSDDIFAEYKATRDSLSQLYRHTQMGVSSISAAEYRRRPLEAARGDFLTGVQAVTAAAEKFAAYRNEFATAAAAKSSSSSPTTPLLAEPSPQFDYWIRNMINDAKDDSAQCIILFALQSLLQGHLPNRSEVDASVAWLRECSDAAIQSVEAFCGAAGGVAAEKHPLVVRVRAEKASALNGTVEVIGKQVGQMNRRR